MNRYLEVLNLPLRYHLAAGLFIRLFLIVYADFHDKTYDLPYTDIDYSVFSDAARHVYNGDSPYKRQTYRYSPLISYLLVPNIIFGKDFGKILFSVFDLFITVAVKNLVEHQLGPKSAATNVPMYCSFLWLYNPLSIGISTRGNADSVSCFTIILSLLLLQTDVVKGLKKYALSGLFLGISIHLRLYPIVFSFPMYLSLGVTKIPRQTTLRQGMLILWPNISQLILATSCIVTLFSLTYSMYALYGYDFLYETYIYHVHRTDTRHNFSVLFYYSYLNTNQGLDIVKNVTNLFKAVILFLLSVKYGPDPKTLPLAMFCQTVVVVAFNSVMTSQYFVWFLSLLPLVAHSFRMKLSKALLLAIIWVTAQGAWLFYAYLLEFKGREVFFLIWLKGVVFFCSNIFVLVQLLRSYTIGYGFGFGQAVHLKTQ
ncbi:hypothetical protein HF086_007560 [Spodoptera exigua]|uniref:GPI alpha-1,4-mannosyltransferase I, catalytic subunit n=1 Tax=Spodoptera exigua TaxID=7107 RepID=A0A922MTG9_SPOEX|nr:hypothetical protein HF086_007560 [Spodoptera exigua]